MAEPVLKKGSNDPAVRDLQEVLKVLGFDPVPVDGVFGALTESAVKKFQQVREIPADARYGGQVSTQSGALGSLSNGGLCPKPGIPRLLTTSLPGRRTLLCLEPRPDPRAIPSQQPLSAESGAPASSLETDRDESLPFNKYRRGGRVRF
jgi:peptidoglycan hydrolase-like protein with peptidoglycan-binding domain